jgi:hypothetical protein
MAIMHRVKSVDARETGWYAVMCGLLWIHGIAGPHWSDLSLSIILPENIAVFNQDSDSWALLVNAR